MFVVAIDEFGDFAKLGRIEKIFDWISIGWTISYDVMVNDLTEKKI